MIETVSRDGLKAKMDGGAAFTLVETLPPVGLISRRRV
jgi:hypothetical protein